MPIGGKMDNLICISIVLYLFGRDILRTVKILASTIKLFRVGQQLMYWIETHPDHWPGNFSEARELTMKTIRAYEDMLETNPDKKPDNELLAFLRSLLIIEPPPPESLPCVEIPERTWAIAA